MNRLTILGSGTSSGVPVVGCGCEVCLSDDPRDKRLRTSAYLVTEKGTRLLFDVGPDFRAQSLANGVVWIDGILITHAHQDHIGGLDELRQNNFVMKKAVDVYGNRIALDEIQVRFDYIFKQTVQEGGGKPQVLLKEAIGDFEVNGETVMPLPVMHGEIPILGYRVGNLSYITDASAIPETTMERLKGTKVLVLNALRFHPHPTHFSFRESLEIVDRIRPESAYFVHLTHLFKQERDEKLLPPGVHFAVDGMRIEY